MIADKRTKIRTIGIYYFSVTIVWLLFLFLLFPFLLVCWDWFLLLYQSVLLITVQNVLTRCPRGYIRELNCYYKHQVLGILYIAIWWMHYHFSIIRISTDALLFLKNLKSCTFTCIVLKILELMFRACFGFKLGCINFLK